MKRYKIVTFVLSVAILLSVYAGAKENVVITDPALVKIDGQYYIQLADYGDGGSCCQIAKYIQFSSMDEMYTRIKNLDFTEEEFDDMCDNFRRTDNGLKILDIDNLYQPKFPENVSMGDVIEWTGGGYRTSWDEPDIGNGTFYLSDEEEYFSRWKGEVGNYKLFEKDHVEVLESSESVTDKYTMKKRTYTVLASNGRKGKYIREDYKFVKGDYHCDAIVEYCLEAAYFNVTTSDVKPYRIDVFADNGDVYWQVEMYDDSIKSAVDIDWLMSFDVEKYVPTTATDNNNSN